MGVPPMSITGVSPVSGKRSMGVSPMSGSREDRGKMPLRLTGKMPVPLCQCKESLR